MSIGGIGGGDFPKILTSGIDSIASGLSQVSTSGGLSAIKEGLQIFGGEGTKPFASIIQNFSPTAMAGPAHLDAPHDFFNKLSLASNASSGKFPASELSNKLQDSSLNLRSGLDGLLSSFEEKLNTIGDDAQLANVDLQNILQKQQQTLQMLSNLSKMFQDTSMSLIRNIKG